MLEHSRYERLRADLDALRRLREQSTIFDFQVTDESSGPPEQYLLTFRGKGATRKDAKSPVVVSEFHQVEITMGPYYPTLEPTIRWKTPFFHPNVTDKGEVFFGAWGQDWVTGLGLDTLCERLWDMIRYAVFDTTRPLNFDAADWTRSQGYYKFPLDSRPLRDKPPAAAAEPSNVIFFDDAPPPRVIPARPFSTATRVSAPVHQEEGIEFISDESAPPAPAPSPPAVSTPPAPPPPRVVRVPIVTTEEEKKKEEEDILFLEE
jgi:ubiquitin-protein ligase